MTTKERIVSPEVSAVIGAVAGTVEVCIQQPTVSWKNSLQQKLPLSLNPTVIYRGTVMYVNLPRPRLAACSQMR